jgi:glutathione synthase/RimK-type ligase-like ATP-grasp enzyme
MNTRLIVVDRIDDWAPFYPAENLITAEKYLVGDPCPEAPALVINLCRDYRYLGKGYYCSLLAEARGDRVIPSVRTINELSRRRMYSLGLSALEKVMQQQTAGLGNIDLGSYTLKIFFGITQVDGLQGLARQVFDLFPCPIEEVVFKRMGGTWAVEGIRPMAIHQLDETGQDEFAAALDHFSSKVWKRPRQRKTYRYDLAMLVDPGERFPPSNRKALENFVRAGRQIGINVEPIARQDYTRLTEYDALFIRETTSVVHHTYQFAQKAEFLNIPVIDDTNSILKCANKVYLAELLSGNNISTPPTCILHKDNPASLTEAAGVLGFPLVLKTPDGSFSRGVFKVDSMRKLKESSRRMFQASVLILAQKYVYTDFDWRIGVLGGRPLFTCKYFMSEGHWQIYNHAVSGSRCSGGFTSLAIEQTPAAAVKTAVKAAGLIGNGLYGVDLKHTGDGFSVIEINDNPNIDAGIEDLHLGKVLYHRIMENFFGEMERCRYG